jgi:hypothetical protein
MKKYILRSAIIDLHFVAKLSDGVAGRRLVTLRYYRLLDT